MNNQDLSYRLGISLEADKLFVAEAKRQNLKDSASFFAREAQAARRELREIA